MEWKPTPQGRYLSRQIKFLEALKFLAKLHSKLREPRASLSNKIQDVITVLILTKAVS